MTKVSKRLTTALESDCAENLCQVIRDGKLEDFEALQSLLSLDSSVKSEVRAKVIHALGRWGDPAPVAAIRSILPDLDETGRISAIDALGRLGTQEAADTIKEYANDASPHVRKFVVYGLGRINTQEARAKLKRIEAEDTVDHIRALASKYLQR